MMFCKAQYYGQLNIEKVLFEFEREPIVLICNNTEVEIKRLRYEDIDHSELPDANVRVQNSKCADYIQFLQSEM